MKVLIIHEHYRHRGGEDRVFDTERAMLAERGIQVIPFVADNLDIDEDRAGLGLALRAIWSSSSYQAIRRLIAAERPHIVHVHNTFPLLSPAVLRAAAASGVPVVQTLHNYRLICVGALLSRNGVHCEDCLGRTVGWPGVMHRCYRDSLGASATIAVTNAVHAALGTWQRGVSLYLALSPFARDRFIAGGLPADRITVRPNPVPDPGDAAATWNDHRAGAIFLGRLSPEKGILGLLEAWRGIGHPLTIIGDGPLAAEVRRRAPEGVTLTGQLPPEAVSQALRRAALVCVPSLCAENFPMAIAEAMGHGVPVLASDLGAMRHMVVPHVTGALAPPGDWAAWHHQARTLLDDRDGLVRMGAQARIAFRRDYAPETVMNRLIALYDQLLENRR
jgi:glycosyltransferase involved in cell wall biosynthesis